MIPRLKLLAAPVVLVVMGAGCGFLSDQDALREMSVVRLSGTVTLVRDGASTSVTDESGLEPGDQITTAAEGGRAELRLEGERRVELAPGSRIEVAPSGVTGLEGSLLAEPSSGDRLHVRFGEARAQSDNGTFRVDLGPGSSRVGVYRGAATVSTPGQRPATIDALFQAEAAANSRILSASPLRISERDAWDRIELRSVLDLDERLERLGAGLTTQLGAARPTIGYFSSLADRPVGWLGSYLDERVPDLLINFSIARTTEGPLSGSFRRARSLHLDGGRWGLVAAIMQARERALVAQLSRSILSTGVLAASSAGAGPTFAIAAGTDPAAGGPTLTTSPGTGGGGPQPPPGDREPPPDDPPDDPGEDPCADPTANLEECADDIVPPVGGGSDDDEDGGLVDGLLDTVGGLVGGG